ncbi:hypothetical protein KVR01_001248 [Diaporthe batatas]|uniref:uncharacterized protein n=1 Tax=Diaporthe batatas TaxID=748121 RepID=UPI001D049803|nr:uncharacterized protein KVR01_001248 [Diaporthe batatas]KAG8168499.1 hypothetical protein KVR01_001248 [Diaporthe batatas]
MKFCLAAMAAFALSSVSAEAFVERQSPTVVGTIDASVATVNYTVSTYLVTIASSIAVIKNEPNAYTAIAQQAINAIKNSAKNITAALTDSSGNIIRVTTTGLGELNIRAAILVQSEIDMLARDIDTIKNILTNINASVKVVHADLDQTVNALVRAEFAALSAALRSFVGPVAAFASAAATLSITASVTGIRNAITSLISIIAGVYATLGI